MLRQDMNELLEYTQFSFEERFINSEIPFMCIKEQVKLGARNCICTPGIAFNYVCNVIKCCYEEFQEKACVVWDKENGIYLAKGKYQGINVACNFHIESETQRCYFMDYRCGEQLSEYLYYKPRTINELEEIYKKADNDKWDNKEIFCVGKTPLFNQAEDYFRLFILLCDEYRQLDPNEYTEQLFRLFLFLFPYTAKTVIKENWNELKQSENSEEKIGFITYHQKLFADYMGLIHGIELNGLNETISILDLSKRAKSFIKLDFLKVYKRYCEEWPIRLRDFSDIMRKQFSVIKYLQRDIDKLLNEFKRISY